MKRIQKGFTLIELMIVVAIIGILAAVAIPAYQDYVVKAKLSKVQTTLDPIKLGLSMYYQEQGAFPVDTTGTASTTAAAAGNVWSSIGLTTGTMPTVPAELTSVTYKSDANGTNALLVLTFAPNMIRPDMDSKTITFLGSMTGTAVTWNCSAASAVGTPTANAIALKYFGGTANPNCVN